EDNLDGADLLDAVCGNLMRFVVFPNVHAVVAVTLWVAVTHALEAFEFATRLVINSPSKRCGKSRLLEVIKLLVRDELSTINASVSAIFRSIGDDPPTLIFDEVDTVFGPDTKADSEPLRGLINGGYQFGATFLRSDGPTHTPKKFPIFAMCAL